MIYWENVAIFIAILFLWVVSMVWYPSLLLSPHFRKIRFSERILFYQVVSVLYITGLTFLLGFLKLYHGFTILFGYFFVPVLVVCLRRPKKTAEKIKRSFQLFSDVVQGRYGLNLLLKNVSVWLRKMRNKVFAGITKRGRIEVLWLFILCVALVVYYGMFKFTNHTYAAPDEEVHLYWIQSTLQNNMMPSGMYPYSMHSVIALFCVLLPMADIKIILNFSPIIVLCVFYSFYVLFKKMQRGSWTALAAGTFFAFAGMFTELLYSRFQFTVPMEFGMLGIPAMLVALFNLLQEKEKRHKWLFALAVAFSISAHFYAGILAAIVCLCYGVVYLKDLIKRNVFGSVIVAGICGTLLACAPFGIGLLTGQKFEQSMEWALDVMQSEAATGGMDIEENVQYWLNPDGSISVVDKTDATGREMSLREYELRKIWFDLWTQLHDMLSNTIAMCFFGIVLFGTFFFGIVGSIASKQHKIYFQFMVGASLSAIFMIALIWLPALGVPELVEISRAKVFLFVWFVVLMFCVFEMVTFAVRKAKMQKTVLVIALCALFGFLAITNNLHRVRVVYCMNHEEATYACLKIMEAYGKENFTIVSTTNELSAIRNYGYHVEWIDFLTKLEQAEENERYTIPGETVFFIVEKEILDYGELDYEDDGFGNEVIGQISEQSADIPIEEKYLEAEGAIRSEVYKTQRDVVMSKAYYWAIEYQKYYEEEFRIVYETDKIAVFQLEQNPYALHNLILPDDV